MKTKALIMLSILMLFFSIIVAGSMAKNSFLILGIKNKTALLLPGDRFVDAESNYFVDSNGDYLTGATP